MDTGETLEGHRLARSLGDSDSLLSDLEPFVQVLLEIFGAKHREGTVHPLGLDEDQGGGQGRHIGG